jgi:hypothetical protein
MDAVSHEYQMRKMEVKECEHRIRRHLKILYDKCPNSRIFFGDKFGMGISVDVYVEPYFIATFIPESGKFLISGQDETGNQNLAKWFQHIMECDCEKKPAEKCEGVKDK